MSPSSRRAWIEIGIAFEDVLHCDVALLAEGVDRNSCSLLFGLRPCVALLAEGVDRNRFLTDKVVKGLRRPPRGGRG